MKPSTTASEQRWYCMQLAACLQQARTLAGKLDKDELLEGAIQDIENSLELCRKSCEELVHYALDT